MTLSNSRHIKVWLWFPLQGILLFIKRSKFRPFFFQPAVSWTSEYQFYNLHSFVAEWSSCFMADIGSKNPQIKTIGNEVSKRTWRYYIVSPLNWKISKLWPDLSWASFGAKRREIEDEKFNTGNSVVNGKYVSRRCNNHGLSHPFAVLHNTEEQSNCSS